MILINDLHLSVNRVSGTTQQSREDLRNYTFAKFSELLRAADGHDLCILGDLFDGFEVAPRDWLDTYLHLAAWCDNNPIQTLCLVAGNHDVSAKGNRVSSFETLSTVLAGQFDNVVVAGIDETRHLYDYVWIIAHHRNQDLFDLALKNTLEHCSRGDYVLLHANYDNKFAEQSDHSLNVSEDQALEFTNKGVNLVFAHEHLSRVEVPHGTPADGGTVTVLGNQIPTSVADCIGNSNKFYWSLQSGNLQKYECWSVGGDFGYAAIDWRDLAQSAEGPKFIRVVGNALNAEAAQVVDAIAKFRQKSSAFVITNAVKIEGIADIDALPETFESAKSFDVLEFVYAQLDEAEREVIKKIVEEME